MIHVQTPHAKSMDQAIAEAFAHFGCEPLGGPSKDGWSKTSDLQRCAYRYYLKHEAQVYIPTGSPVAPPLEIGGLFHALLALHYCRMLPEGYPGWRKNSPSPLDFLDYLRTCGAEAINVHEATRLYSAYAESYDNDDLVPVAVEMPAGIEGVHTCRYDLLAWHEGALWCVEHKTARSMTAEVLESWWLDGEILGELYAWKLSNLTEKFGAPLAGVLINIVSKTNPPACRRLEVVVPPVVLDGFMRDRQWWAQQREHMRRTGQWPRSLHGCISRYEMCHYWSHCRDEDASILVRRAA